LTAAIGTSLPGEHLKGHGDTAGTKTFQLMDLSACTESATKVRCDSIDRRSGDLLVGIGIKLLLGVAGGILERLAAISESA
jgi:hypothetical protein